MFLRFFPLFLVLLGSAHAAGKRQFRTLYYGKPAGAPDQITLTCGQTALQIPLPPANLSAPQELPAGTLEALFSSQPLPPKSEPPAGLPKAEIPDSWKDVLFLFTPDPANAAAPFRVTAMDLGGEKFKAGQLLFFNRSKASLTGKVGSRDVKLAPLQSAYVDIPAEGNNDYSVSIDMVMPGEKDARPLCRSTWRQTKEDRMLVFVVPDPVRKSLSIASVPIHPLPPDKEKAQ